MSRAFSIRHWSLLILLLLFVQPLWGRDAFVLISGGDSPLENNYSQYLQARAMTDFFHRNYPSNSVWIFFGAGNIEGEKPFFADVRRKIKRDGLTLDSWLPGTLNRNRPAKRELIMRTFREEILPSVANGGTLYLFVGDHGARPEGDDQESIINLWALDSDPGSNRGWRENSKEILGVSELRDLISSGIGRGKVVFCMTQCHAGGFHFLSVPRQMKPNPAWFTLPPDGLLPSDNRPRLLAAGFTATDEFSPAAGCDPDPDPDNWAGYERYFPENLLGADLFTLKQVRKPRGSFTQAHIEATLVDATIDKPYSTSEQYLERWATLIETRLTNDAALTKKARQQVAAYHRAVDGAPQRVQDRAFRERQALFRRFVQQLCKQNPAARDVLLNGTRQELQRAIDGPRRRGPRDIEPRAGSAETQAVAQTAQEQPSRPPGRPGSGRSRFGEMRRLWSDSIRPAWKDAVEADAVPGMAAAALDFEKHLLNHSQRGRDFIFAGGDALADEVFWYSGYHRPESLDTARAEAIARWAIERRSKIVHWAENSDDPEVRSAAERLLQSRRRPSPPRQSSPATRQQISRETAAERTLFYRRTLAAWAFLVAMNERPALHALRALSDLEQTPLPRR